MSEIHRTARSGAPVTGEDPDLMIRLTNVSKVYRLGEIGSGTLYRDLQSWQAKRKGLPGAEGRFRACCRDPSGKRSTTHSTGRHKSLSPSFLLDSGRTDLGRK